MSATKTIERFLILTLALVCLLEVPAMALRRDLVSWTEVGAPVLTTPAPGLCAWLDDGSPTGGFPGGAMRTYRIGTR